MMTKQTVFQASVVLFSMLFIASNAQAQGCCGIGGSLVSGGHPILDKKTLLLTSSGNYADAKEPEDRRRGSVGVMLAYGITDRLSLSLKTSYIWARYSYYKGPIELPDTTIPEETVIRRNHGVGDGFAALQFAIIRMTPMNKQELITGMDIGIPWGPDSARVDGVLLPGNVQTGTGMFSMNGFLTYLKAFPAIHYAVTSTIAGRVKLGERKIEGSGNEFSIMLTSLFGPFFDTRGSVTFNYFQYGKNVFNFQTGEADTQIGKRVSVIPALEYSFTPDLKLSINADIPLIRNDVENTFGNDKALKAEVYWFIPFAENNSNHVKSISF